MPDSITLAWPGGPLQGTAQLPASKSESNRALIIQALAGNGTLSNLSDANDTQLMRRLLANSIADTLDAEDAGTVMRFLTAYLSVTNRQALLTGTARMRERPIGVLVDALRQLGMQIDYAEKEGYPPLNIKGWGANLPAEEMAELTVRGDISSQYISALLMIGPQLPGGLRLFLTGKVGSRPYIRMTLSLMQHFGADCRDLGSVLEVRPTSYKPADYAIEADWSAASYWYSMVALSPAGGQIHLPGLRRHSLQGDQAIVGIMEKLGVATEFVPDGVLLTQQPPTGAFSQDFTDCPDLAQTVAVIAAAQGISVEMTGLESLRIKETDRILALQTEVAKFGATLTEEKPDVFRVATTDFEVNGQTVATYHDHRMAMAFAPLALRGPLTINAPQVVRKSYPSFWDELEQAGFKA
ncbi:3-phosphoshikimate 1-carboxyvinyltransferase [Hymenobacter qilianensis]|uniref:3-phosphoshikimate 1-carboxyvinyltransferase n=2 Tax=Hymenobacter qilianensis TaxID=1385715 RepID=A0ACB5PSX9_9BACT|nr:3-phosphoshikimate 1-carboxyvinyltransferase [Hymenobacter qilianensis]QNP52569.1 3-phosphoshikimate 1-carboxyvinyltransferase [Hymenobacter qilianensis]GGF68801.1 3-phosphoshikimate 1-carboxyvinyltransferase [Hymenobacter qilianensis]